MRRCHVPRVSLLGLALVFLLSALIPLSAHFPAQDPLKPQGSGQPPTQPLPQAHYEALTPSQAPFRPQSQAAVAPIIPLQAAQPARPAAQPPAARSAAAKPAPAQPLVFRNQIVFDQQFMNMEAFRLLVPKDWTFSGGITWNFNRNPPEPYTLYTVSSPDGNAVIQQYPRVNFFSSTNQMSLAAQAQAGISIMQPLGAIDFLQRVFIAQARQGVSDLKVLEAQPLPALAQYNLRVSNMLTTLFGQISPFTFAYENRVDAGHVKVEYTQNGRRIIEDFTANIGYFITNMPVMGMYVQEVNWWASVSSFRAPAEDMPSKVRMFQIAVYSRFDNPVFNVSYTRLAALVTREQLRQQQAIFARFQQIRKTLEETNDIIWQTYQNRSASYDRMFDNYSQAYRGVDTYVDPVNNWNIELPTGYDNAWTNGNEYIFSDSPSYNPNISSTGNWTQMTRKR
jgi:hypothetical protein